MSTRSSSPRLLSAPPLEAPTRTLGAPDPALDAAFEARLATAVAEAHAAGRRAGAVEAAAAADAAAERVLGALVDVDTRLRRLAAAADVALAAQIARVVLDREPGDDSATLLRRVERVLGEVDDHGLEVRLHPDDASQLRPALQRAAVRLGVALEVVEDRTVDAGGALLAGRWARADLTRAGAWDVVQAALGDGDG